jgi:hypothetical protein
VSAGFGDGVSRVVTLGQWSTADFRAFHGIDGGVDTCSASYRGGKYAGWAWGGLTLGVAGLNGGTASTLWHGGATAASNAAAIGTVVSDTLIGGILDAAGVENPLIWKAASAIYAANIDGVAIAVVEGEVEEGSVFALERAILNWRGIPIIYAY